MNTLQTYTGGCHCGAVRFEADLDLTTPAGRCNCTLCTKIAHTSMNVKPAALRVVKGSEALTEYRGAGGPNWRAFCKHCGCHCFGGGYVEQIGGDFRTVNLSCLDDVDVNELTVLYIDGRHDNWMAGLRSTPWPIRG